ncbi:MAG: thioredoxin family protein [Calditrichia bacterium]
MIRDAEIKNASDYQELLENMRRKIVELKPEMMNEPHFKFIPLNYRRFLRIYKTYRMSDNLREALQSVEQNQLWLVLTEDSCGDSAQTLPMIARMAEVNPKIELKFLYREQNPDLMDHYLTDGKRSIPKLIAFDGEGVELFQWGPRPAPAHILFKRSRENGLSKEQILQKLHAWYAADRCKSLEAELLAILRAIHQQQDV